MSDKNCLRDNAILKKIDTVFSGHSIATKTEVRVYDVYECQHCGELSYFRRD